MLSHMVSAAPSVGLTKRVIAGLAGRSPGWPSCLSMQSERDLA